jgi:hypothetical protein
VTCLSPPPIRVGGPAAAGNAGELVIGSRIRYGNITAIAIESTPSSVRAINPKFRRVRRFDSIEGSRTLMEMFPLRPNPETQVA